MVEICRNVRSIPGTRGGPQHYSACVNRTELILAIAYQFDFICVHLCASVVPNFLLPAAALIDMAVRGMEPQMHTDAHRCTQMHTDAPRGFLVGGNPLRRKFAHAMP